MITLINTLSAIGQSDFKQTFKQEVEQLDAKLLPLQEGLSLSSYVSEEPFSAVPLSVNEEADVITVKSGIFYSGIIAGCSCSDDPTPNDKQNEYCEIQFIIDRHSGETSVTLLDD
ncbi:hypothetical protein BOW53_12135 [Solemya pervernicosa gill symbiont]|uniref:Uncharacterized protein n=1 Tax=Solemya pervernicosa gill symbiont TaxID=642797 RepID=A0A1T2L2I5_9GAMM|nr:hypothetical protein [Solemya pervernicosa gill symbiont]OOZ39303.1 hypothetical protein BOW53_12135 [Solemya pervernicosa gill symbiont]